MIRFLAWLLILSIITSQEIDVCSEYFDCISQSSSADQCHVTQAGVGLVGAPGRRLGQLVSHDIGHVTHP